MNEDYSNKDPVIETIKLAKVFKDFWHRDKVRAVDGLSLKIMPGEIFGLLGPNGSGKTTTLKLMLGLLFPTSGLVRIFGRSPGNVAVKSRIGFLPEESYFYRHLSASETMNFYGALFEIPGQERLNRGKKLLEMLGLGASLTRPVGEYSKGMMRRIGLAQALINDPDLIIMDEPTSGLDPIGRKEVKNLIIELKKMGKTVLLSSHLLAEVQDVCDRICILYGGKKIAEGRVDEVLLKKNTAQVSFPAVSTQITEKIRDFALNASGSADVKLSSPVESLEDFFLREIEKLQGESKSRKAALENKPAEKLSILQELSAGEPRGIKKEKKTPPEPAVSEKKSGEVLKNLVWDKSAVEAEKSDRNKKIQQEKDARKDDVFKKLLEKDRE
jgi:ABC-2 type transport system ATP-binding protein